LLPQGCNISLVKLLLVYHENNRHEQNYNEEERTIIYHYRNNQLRASVSRADILEFIYDCERLELNHANTDFDREDETSQEVVSSLTVIEPVSYYPIL